MAARFPDPYYDNGKYAARGKKGRFVRADSKAAQRYVYERMGETMEHINKRLFRDCDAAASKWARTHLSAKGSFANPSDASVPFATGNLLSSMVVTSWGHKNSMTNNYYSNFTARQPQRWGVPSRGEGLGVNYRIQTDFNPLRLTAHKKYSDESGLYGVAEGRGAGVMLTAGIPYAGPLNSGTKKNPYYIGWFTRMAVSLGRAMMNQVGVVGYNIEVEIIRSIEAGNEGGGLASSVNYRSA